MKAEHFPTEAKSQKSEGFYMKRVKIFHNFEGKQWILAWKVMTKELKISSMGMTLGNQLHRMLELLTLTAYCWFWR